MATEAIKIRAKAGKLLREGHSELEGYRRMPIDELETLIKNIGKVHKSAPATSEEHKPAETAAKGKAKRPTAVSGTKVKDASTRSTIKKGGTKMAKTLKEMPVAQRGGGAGRPAKYPYDEWLDGSILELEQGKDFECTVATMSALLRKTSNERGHSVSIVRTGEDTIAIQAVESNGRVSKPKAEAAVKKVAASTKLSQGRTPLKGAKKGR